MSLKHIKHLPPDMRPSEEQQKLYLGLTQAIFEPIREDTKSRTEETAPLRAYLLLDAAADPDIFLAMNGYSNPSTCLFDGEVADDLEMVGPWLAEVTEDEDDSVWAWFANKGYGNNWGIIIQSRLELRRLKTQLKKYLKIEDDDGDKYFLKFYRPDSFNTFLPEFTDEQRRSFARGIEAVFAEVKDITGRSWRHGIAGDGSHVVEIIDLAPLGEAAFAELDADNDDDFWASAAELEQTNAT